MTTIHDAVKERKRNTAFDTRDFKNDRAKHAVKFFNFQQEFDPMSKKDVARAFDISVHLLNKFL